VNGCVIGYAVRARVLGAATLSFRAFECAKNYATLRSCQLATEFVKLVTLFVLGCFLEGPLNCIMTAH